MEIEDEEPWLRVRIAYLRMVIQFLSWLTLARKGAFKSWRQPWRSDWPRWSADDCTRSMQTNRRVA